MVSISGKIDKVIDELAMGPINGFYPTYIAKCTDLPLDRVLEYLNILVMVGKLVLKWEIHCENYDCVNTIKEFDVLPTDAGTFYCDICGEEIEVTEANIFPKFVFNKEYKADRRQYFNDLKKKHKNLHPKFCVRFKAKKYTP